MYTCNVSLGIRHSEKEMSKETVNCELRYLKRLESELKQATVLLRLLHGSTRILFHDYCEETPHRFVVGYTGQCLSLLTLAG